jgi:Transposase
MMTTIIDSLRSRVPAGLEELAQLGRTLWRCRADVLAYFDHHSSNEPTEATYAATTGIYTGVSDEYRNRLLQRAFGRHPELWEAQ